MRIAAISGSPQPRGSTAAILAAMAELAPAMVEFEVVDLLGDLPQFSPLQPPSDRVSALYDFLREADAILVATPEYAHAAPGRLKNALDWIVSSDGVLTDKPMALVTAAPGPAGGVRAQASILPTMLLLGGAVADTVVIPFSRRVIQDGRVVDGLTRERLRLSIRLLARAVGDDLEVRSSML